MKTYLLKVEVEDDVSPEDVDKDYMLQDICSIPIKQWKVEVVKDEEIPLLLLSKLDELWKKQMQEMIDKTIAIRAKEIIEGLLAGFFKKPV